MADSMINEHNKARNKTYSTIELKIMLSILRKWTIEKGLPEIEVSGFTDQKVLRVILERESRDPRENVIQAKMWFTENVKCHS